MSNITKAMSGVQILSSQSFVLLYFLCFLHVYIFTFCLQICIFYFFLHFWGIFVFVHFYFVLLYFLYFCTFSVGWTVHMNCVLIVHKYTGIWSVLPGVDKMCIWWPKTCNTFWVIATKLFCQIWWLMSLSKRNDPFVMHNV